MSLGGFVCLPLVTEDLPSGRMLITVHYVQCRALTILPGLCLGFHWGVRDPWEILQI